jgi:hypothetical protein
MDLVNAGEVDFDLAKAAATNPADFDLKMNMFNDPAGGEKAGDGNMKDEMTQMFGG